MTKKIKAPAKRSLSFRPKSAHMKAAEAENHLDAWRTVFEKTNRIVSGRPVKVTLVSEKAVTSLFQGRPVAPGFTVGDSIHFTSEPLTSALKNEDPTKVALQMKGLNYHELSHVLYSPREGSDFDIAVRRLTRTYGHEMPMWAANLLEDQRIETWFSATYTPAKRYFEAMAVKHILANTDERTAMFLHGRKFLSPALRTKAKAVYIGKFGQSEYDAMADIIDKYVANDPLVHPVVASRLVQRMCDLLMRQGGTAPPAGVGDNCVVSDDRDSSTKALPPSAMKQRQEAKKNADQAAKDQAEADEQAEAEAEAAAEAEGASESDNTEGDPTEGDNTDGDPTEGDADDGDATEGDAIDGDAIDGDAIDGDADGDPTEGDADGDPTEGDSAEGGNADGDPIEGGNAAEGDSTTEGDSEGIAEDSSGGAAFGQSGDHTVKDVLASAQESLDEIESDAEVIEDLANTLRSIRKVMTSGKANVSAGKTPHGDVPAEERVQQTSRKVLRSFQKIFAVAEPEIMRGQTTGRLDTRRFLQARPNDRDVFTSYDEGMEDETGVEAVILLDYSGSMSGDPIEEASKSIWALKNAFDKVGVSCTVMAYDEWYTVLYKANEKAGPRVRSVYPMGGTEPTAALHQALRILRASSMPNKILVTITDGEWFAEDSHYEPIMKDFHSLGVSSMLLGLRSAVGNYGPHYHEISMDIQRATEIHKPVAALVEAILKRSVTV